MFSKEQFLSFSVEKQHKKLRELLREVLQDLKKKESYDQLAVWMGLQPLQSCEFEIVEERFSFHVARSRPLSEHDFLYEEQRDKDTSEEWLGIHTYLDGLRSCHNVGSIIRTIEAYRLGPLVLSSDMMEKDHPQVMKRSMGAFPHVEVFHGKALQELPRPLIGVETVPNAPLFNEWVYPKTCTLCFGNEVRGLKKETMSMCDAFVKIPLYGRKNSINVACAFSIVAAEIASQRRKSE